MSLVSHHYALLLFNKFGLINMVHDIPFKTATPPPPPLFGASLLFLFRVVKTTLSSSYNISGLVPVCWLLFQCF